MIGVSGSQALWYTTRATGIVALVLLTMTVALGILTTVRFESPTWPRFTLSLLHRRVSLITMVFLGVHVVSTVLDSFAPIGLVSVVVPFTSPYRRLWLGLGTIAFDLLLAVGVSSLLRQRINPRTWRAIHWLSYAVWPVALVHAFGTGTDPRLHWVLLVVVACVAAVGVAVAWRLVSGWPTNAARRVSIGAAGTLGLIGIASWVAVGPLAPGWAARAGTPASLLHPQAAAASQPATAGVPSPVAANGASSGTGGATATLPAPPYQAPFTGTLSQRQLNGGLVEVDLNARATSGPGVVFAVSLVGTPDGSGGVVMQQGRGTLGTPSSPAVFQGQVVGLQGTSIDLLMHDANGSAETLSILIAINGSAISGTLTVHAGDVGTGEGGGR
jgi:DMSO/TMAO reductase YedYZ heme-binding membrane subunit